MFDAQLLLEELTSCLEEDIEKHDTLNPKLWNSDNTLKKEVREAILRIVDDFVSKLKEDEIKLELKDIKLVGSNCSYNYTDKSDLDIHLVADTETLECPDNLYPLLYSAYRSIWNKNHDVTLNGVPAELFVETSDTEQMTEAKQQTAVKSNGIYSVLKNKWIKEPVAEDIPDIDMDEFEEQFKLWEDRYNRLIGDNEIDVDMPIEEAVITESNQLYGLYAYYIDPQTHKVIEEANDGNPVEVGTRQFLLKKKNEYIDSWNTNNAGTMFKFVIRYIGNE